jgi:hypothetical protein
VCAGSAAVFRHSVLHYAHVLPFVPNLKVAAIGRLHGLRNGHEMLVASNVIGGAITLPSRFRG